MNTQQRAVVQQALAKVRAAQQCHPNAVMTLLCEADELMEQLLEQPEQTDEPAIYPEEAYEMGLERIAYYTRPQPAAQPDMSDALAIAYMDGVFQGKQMAKREWVGLTDEERLQIMDGNTPFNMLVLADEKLREKNGGGV